MQYSLEELTHIFARLGATNPESWARSQHLEVINQLHRFLFLRQAWKCAYSADDDSWIELAIESFRKTPDNAFAGVGRALEELLALGAERQVIVELVRGVQALMLFHISYTLGDPDLTEDDVEEVREMGWALVETDAESNPTDREISCLHESVLETDPRDSGDTGNNPEGVNRG